MTKLEVTLKLDRSTKNTHVFKAQAEGGPLETLYVEKSAFGGQPAPVFIKVSIEPVTD